VHCLDSARPGPDAMINAVMHGNELCGAIALDRLLRTGFRPTRGRLTLCFANPEAYWRFDPTPPPKTLLEVTHGYTIRTDDFYFTARFTGLERFPCAGEVFAVDGGEEVRTPYDNCVLVMPNHRAAKGQRAFRLARPAAE